MATTLVGVSAVLTSQANERKRTTEKSHRLEKIEIYQGFISMRLNWIGATMSIYHSKKSTIQSYSIFI